ncbi:MAG: hypothetical protein J5I94_20790 [Phaeodactylibacter sp.]|nr:hypothetical protein [Phaeodactylibacter sp.]
MPFYQSTYHSRIFRDFREIDAVNYRRIIRFYEDKEEDIKRLDFDEYFELITAYVNALFEVGAYQKHLLMVDVVVEMVIVNNVEVYKGEDIYQKMLFRKAASLYNILEYAKAEYILRELIKIDPFNEDFILFLRKCLRKKEPGFLNKAKATGILLFLLSAFVISVEVLFIRPFYKNHVDVVESSRTAIFLLGCTALVGGTLLHRWLVQRQVSRFVEKTRNAKYY